MPRKYAVKRRRTPRKRTVKRKRRMNRMQKTALSYVRKKYTTVLPLIADETETTVTRTVSHIGGRNSSDPTKTLTLLDCNPDEMLEKDMELYQFFKISGVAFKVFFPEGTTPEATPVQWSLGYSANNVLKSSLAYGPLQSLATFQTSSCSALRPIKRYFRTATTLKRLGIEWASTDELQAFGADPPVPLYGKQLPINDGSSTLIRVIRPATATTVESALARIQLTYYVQYKGTKGVSSLV